jgi:hypothetical protein
VGIGLVPSGYPGFPSFLWKSTWRWRRTMVNVVSVLDTISVHTVSIWERTRSAAGGTKCKSPDLSKLPCRCWIDLA